MALDVLLQAIADDGASEVRQIVDAARVEASAIRTSADMRAQHRIAETCAAREAELRTALDSRLARARNEARVQVLLARAQFVDRIFRAAEAALPGILERNAAHETLAMLCREALDFFPDGARIRCRGALAPMIAVSLPGAAVVVDDEVPEGVIVETIDGRSRIDNTLAARLRRRRAELSIAIIAAASGTA